MGTFIVDLITSDEGLKTGLHNQYVVGDTNCLSDTKEELNAS